jgi:aminoglycoside phosphotransferase family enzyme/predicted kinase
MTEPNPADIADLFAAPPERVIETHISRVFLCGDRAWKLKQAVTLPYVDFGSLEQRRVACEREVALNRRTAPDLYLGCRAVYRDNAGSLTFSTHGLPVEWLVEMRRFPSGATLDELAARHGLTPSLIEGVADAVADFHSQAMLVDVDPAATVERTLRLNREAVAHLAPDALPAGAWNDLESALTTEFERQRDALSQRKAAGRMRHGHGDLHLRNIALIDGRPVLFDCLEFDDGLAETDTLYDFAFLLMDLLQHGCHDLANRALNRYLDRTGDYAGLSLLPLYVALRAAIRCHIAAMTPAGQAEACRYLDLALWSLRGSDLRLMAVGGYSGTGKTTVARVLAGELLHRPWGGVLLRSDVLRKQMHGVALTQTLPRESYTTEDSRRVYAAMLEWGRIVLQGGNAVVLDAVFGRADERAAATELAKGCNAAFTGLWLTAPLAVLVDRVSGRQGDASDATTAVVAWQYQTLQPPLGEPGWSSLDAGGSAESTIALARSRGDPAAGIPAPGLLSKANQTETAVLGETGVLSRLSSLIRPRSLAGRIITSLIAGLGLPVVLYAVLMLRTHGYEPMGLCHPTPNGGLIPIDMSRGSGIPTGCGVDWGFVASNILQPGLGFALLAYILMALLARAER